MYAVVVEKVKLTFVKIVLLKQRDPLLKLSICDAMLVILYYNIGELCLLTYKSNTKDNLENNDYKDNTFEELEQYYS